VATPELSVFARPSSKVWLVINIAGAALFLWQSQQLWLRRDEGYTFGDGASLFFLLVIFGVANVAMLLLKSATAFQFRSWRVLSGPVTSLAIWGSVITFHFVRMRLFA
jgi:phage-related holin